LLSSFPSNPLPEFKSPVSTGHVLNAMALLAQAFDKPAAWRPRGR
jgi:hypothetical protein